MGFTENRPQESALKMVSRMCKGNFSISKMYI